MSARQPDYSAAMVEPLIEQIMAILQRDLAANLTTVNADAAYPAIGAYNTNAKDIYENAPEIVIEAIESAIAPDEQIALTVQHIFAVSAVVVGAGDTEELARQARDYARALVMTLGRQEDFSDYERPLEFVDLSGNLRSTIFPGLGTVKDVSIHHIGWALKAPQAAQFSRQPIVELAISTVEI